MTASITTFCIKCHYDHCHCAECHNLFIVMLNVIMLSDIMLNVITLSDVMLSVVILSDVMLNVFMLSDVMLNVVMLSDVMLIVVAPLLQLKKVAVRLSYISQIISAAFLLRIILFFSFIKRAYLFETQRIERFKAKEFTNGKPSWIHVTVQGILKGEVSLYH